LESRRDSERVWFSAARLNRIGLAFDRDRG